MTKTPGESPGSSSSEAPSTESYRRPGRALIIAAVAYALTIVLLAVYPGMQPQLVEWAPWLQGLADLVVLSAPLVAAVVVAGRLAADGIGRATGIRHWRWFDPVLGVLVALEVRAVVELVEPTTGTILGPLETEITPDVVWGLVVLITGVVLVSPLIEELFFRGLVQRALEDGLRGAGRIIGPLTALLVSTAAFSLLHMLPWQGEVSAGLLVGTIGIGIGCGILTFLTHRLGAAIITHVVYNAIGVVLLVV